MIWIILAILVVLVMLGSFLGIRGGFGFSWIGFYSKGRESGFKFKELRMLRKTAIENKLESPQSLFWSTKQLDRCIRGCIVRLRLQGNLGKPEEVQFVSKLFDLRNKVELESPKYKAGITETQEIAMRQRLRIIVPSIGVFSAFVVENLRRYIAISYPSGVDIPFGFSWKGQRLTVEFWRKGDAGYKFQAKVLENFSDREYPILHIAPTGKLIRSQMRSSVRATVNIPGKLYIMKTAVPSARDIESLDENAKGSRCLLANISAGGAGVLVGGSAKPGIVVLISFALNGEVITLSGTVRGVLHDSANNRSMLSIESLPLPVHKQNLILARVYNILNEEDLNSGDRTDSNGEE